MHLLLLYVVACVFVGYAGRSRRIGFIGFLLVSILLTPVIALLILMLSAPSK